jgi:hypothetical protein
MPSRNRGDIKVYLYPYLLRPYAASQKVAGSIPGVIGIFH